MECGREERLSSVRERRMQLTVEFNTETISRLIPHLQQQRAAPAELEPGGRGSLVQFRAGLGTWHGQEKEFLVVV